MRISGRLVCLSAFFVVRGSAPGGQKNSESKIKLSFWTRPYVTPRWLTKAQFLQLPKEICLREISDDVRRRGHRVRRVTRLPSEETVRNQKSSKRVPGVVVQENCLPTAPGSRKGFLGCSRIENRELT